MRDRSSLNAHPRERGYEMNVQMAHFTDEEIKKLVTLDEAKIAVKRAFEMWAEEKASTTQRSRASVGGMMCSTMVAVVPPFSGGKIYSTNKGVFQFINVLFDHDGQFLCTLDGDQITRLRTAATVDIAIDLMSPKTVSRGALLGAGRQSMMILRTMLKKFHDIQISIYAPRDGAVKKLIAEFPEFESQLFVAESSASAVRGADVIVTATSSLTPLFDISDIKMSALICAVGATKSGRCEVDPSVVERAGAVICDDVVGSKIECGDLIEASLQGKFSWDRAVQFRDVLMGRQIVELGKGPILFETQGVAIQDVAISSLIWQKSQ